jgi:hypothetical protein
MTSSSITWSSYKIPDFAGTLPAASGDFAVFLNNELLDSIPKVSGSGPGAERAEQHNQYVLPKGFGEPSLRALLGLLEMPKEILFCSVPQGLNQNKRTHASLYTLHTRRAPGAVKDRGRGFLRPVHAQHRDEVTCRRR